MQTIRNRLALVLAATALGASLLAPAAASADQDATNTAVAANVSVERASSVESAFVDQETLAVATSDRDLLSDQDLLCVLVGICNP
jgi:hypothetical protein